MGGSIKNMDIQFDIPIAFIIFNKPLETKRVFEQIKKIKPKQLFLISDGPRTGNEQDRSNCKLVKEIVEDINWNCEVHKNYSDVNLGCGKRPASGISWVFEIVDKAIIIEDDCLPNTSFFYFCKEMLERYSEDERIMLISGTNVLGKWKDDKQDYCFSYYGGIWGWATWKRAWKYYDYDIKLWKNKDCEEYIKNLLIDKSQYENLIKIFDKTYKKTEAISWWDYQWWFCRLIQSGLAIVPSKNLISNIGFNKNATHTFDENSCFSNIKSYEFDFPLRFNDILVVDREYDNQYFKLSNKKSINRKILSKIRHW